MVNAYGEGAQFALQVGPYDVTGAQRGGRAIVRVTGPGAAPLEVVLETSAAPSALVLLDPDMLFVAAGPHARAYRLGGPLELVFEHAADGETDGWELADDLVTLFSANERTAWTVRGEHRWTRPGR